MPPSNVQMLREVARRRRGGHSIRAPWLSALRGDLIFNCSNVMERHVPCHYQVSVITTIIIHPCDGTEPIIETLGPIKHVHSTTGSPILSSPSSSPPAPPLPPRVLPTPPRVLGYMSSGRGQTIARLLDGYSQRVGISSRFAEREQSISARGAAGGVSHYDPSNLCDIVEN